MRYILILFLVGMSHSLIFGQKHLLVVNMDPKEFPVVNGKILKIKIFNIDSIVFEGKRLIEVNDTQEKKDISRKRIFVFDSNIFLGKKDPKIENSFLSDSSLAKVSNIYLYERNNEYTISISRDYITQCAMGVKVTFYYDKRELDYYMSNCTVYNTCAVVKIKKLR